jgi:hypothetical protein
MVWRLIIDLEIVFIDLNLDWFTFSCHRANFESSITLSVVFNDVSQIFELNHRCLSMSGYNSNNITARCIWF